MIAGLAGRTAPIFPLLALAFYGALAANLFYNDINDAQRAAMTEVIAVLKEYYDTLEQKVEVKLHGHATGAAGAPKLGDTAAWAPRGSPVLSPPFLVRPSIFGMSSLASSSRLGTSSVRRSETPVTCPPGRATEVTIPMATGSAICAGSASKARAARRRTPATPER